MKSRFLHAATVAGTIAFGLLGARPAGAQMPPMQGGPPPGAPGGGAPPRPPQPTQQKQVGPRQSSQGGDDDDASQRAPLRAEPSIQAPADPLALPPDVAARIGTDDDGRPPAPVGPLERRLGWGYEEKRGDYSFRFLPPLWLEHTRKVPDSAPPAPEAPSTTQHFADDTEGLYGLLFYRRRSPKFDADVLFPLAWRIRDEQTYAYVLGPFAHRESPKEHDNWLAPLVFQGKREHGGYLHLPFLLTTSRWNAEGAFTLAGLYYRDRTGADVSWGLAPFYFHGDNGNLDGARRTYSLVPPLLYYHRENEIDSASITVVGNVYTSTNNKRNVVDILPLFYRITGNPQTGGVRESHTTLFPFFHYGESDAQKLFVIPGYLRRVTPTVDTMLTPIYSNSTTRNGATSLTAIGPIAPIYYRFKDYDTGFGALGLFPFFYGYTGPEGHGIATPLFARFERYGVSRTYWTFPSLVVSLDRRGWETDFHPFVYVGRSGKTSHTVLAPFFWDFASEKSRATVGFPVYWRFAGEAESVVQVAANSVYVQKRVAGGLDWQFHFAPLFSYGEHPEGHFWNVLFGLAGYSRSGPNATVRALWIPIPVARGAEPKAAAVQPESESHGAPSTTTIAF